MITPLDSAPKVSSSQFTVRLVALKLPIAENGSVATATAYVEFDEELPARSITTNARVFEAAENVLRESRQWDGATYEVRESALCQPATENADAGREPDGVFEGARVWLSERW